ncbi:RICIN domain-containing protein [Streptomyces ipomoeae]|uniref:Ricin-type beta-trefoil lectin domain protein n=1 Tax=Streptomyces ipomoeae 91-03 TaxID=698759 RepID=L1L663_9ACTN|nr:RICIN domain-containing protein [Streptomyces ipomoeae]EKX68190.1 ricin-type beta-trefoil lectin domain protein [Streptomyces ipomoeae 91-03]MDX2697854.1 RICIN domain-containing protein [Streptomyces ipomoeae]MDX2843681.1 RICIN domain-containing protein [Streptomyces ipomoeae]
MSPALLGVRPDAARRSRPTTLLLLFLALIVAAATMMLPAADRAHALSRPSQTMYTPPSGAPSPGSLYPRALRLQHNGSANGTLLATFEQYTSGTPVFPIYRSTDNGNSWSKISDVADTQNGWGMRWQPELFELPTAIGGFPAGTILAAGDSVPADRSATKIDLYASTDRGQTWSFVTNIATGGAAFDTNGNTPVWEPFFLVSGNKLIVYYSDQRDPDHGQKIVHQVSTDARTWGPVVDDVAMPTASDRPGMPTVAKLPNGKYVLSYEYGGAPEGNFSVYYKISSDPEAFGSVTGIPLRATDGVVPRSAPYMTWLPTGGSNGTLVVSANSADDLFINTQNGAANTWTRINANVAGGYSRGMTSLPDGHSLLILSAGRGGSNLSNPVTYSTIDLGGGISDGATYTVSNAGSSQLLTIAGGSTTNGTYATQQNADNANDQKWRFDQQPSGYFKIFNVASGKVLGVENQSTANGAKILQWDDNGTPDHEWAVSPHPAGGFSLVNRLTGKYLEIPDASTTVGTTAGQWDSTSCACQRWNLTQTALPPLGTGQYVLVNKNSGKYLEIPASSTTPGKAADQWQNSACDCQLWTFQSQSGGAWTLQNVHSNLRLDVSNSSTSAGAAIVQNTSSAGNSQKWTLTSAGGGYYKIVNVGSGLLAAVAQSSTANGASIIQWNDAGIDDQLWKIVRVN